MSPHASPALAPPSEAGQPPFDVTAATQVLKHALASNAVERDGAGGHAAAERELIRASGLLSLSVPIQYGGLGAEWPTVLRTVRQLAQVDSALAHVFGFHHLQVSSVLLYGHAEQQQRLLCAAIEGREFWGNALNPLDRALVATRVDGGWRLDGQKRYASGSVGSDRLLLSAHLGTGDGAAETRLTGIIPTRSSGIEVREDWDSFGQRQTDSGSVGFNGVFLPQRDVLQEPGVAPTPRSTLRVLLSQLTMANVYLGIAIGAFEAARDFTLGKASPWAASGVERSADDPYVQHRYGQLWLLIRPAQVLADEAAARLQSALDAGPSITAQARGEVAIAVAEAKVLCHRAAVEVSSQFFELLGARAAAGAYGFDRYWRNARVHTLHDPVDYKLRDIGRFRLEDRVPDPTPYS